MSKKSIFLSVLAMMISSIFYGKEQLKDSIIVLDEVVISDSKFKFKKENSGKVIHKITSKTIEQNTGKTVVDLLNSVAGIEINGNTSVMGQNLGIYVRGGRNKEVVILIDGIQVSDPSSVSGGFDLRLLDLNNIKEIEIIKGAASTLYGSGASTAVINITLKTAKKGKMNTSISLIGGNNNAKNHQRGTVLQTKVNLNGKLQKFNYVAYFSSFLSNGVSAAASENNQIFNDDTFSRKNTNLKLEYEFSKRFSIATFKNYTIIENEFDNQSFSDGNNETISENYRIGISPKYKYSKGSVELNAAYSLYNSDFVKSQFPSKNNGKNFNLDAFVKHQFNKIYFLTGVNYQDNSIETFAIPYGQTELKKTKYAENPQTILTDPYINLVYISKKGLNLNTGIRLNNHNKYGSNFVYNLNPSYRILQEKGYVKFLTSYSTAFLAPSVQELFASWGNVNLQPQKSTTFEIGGEFTHKSFTFNGVFFNRNVENIIAYNSKTFKMDNLGNTKVVGIELNSKLHFSEDISINLNYTFTENDEIAIRIPKHKINSSIQYKLENINFLLNYQYLSDRDDTDFRGFPSKNVILDSYSLLDFSANIPANSSLKFFTQITNILNEDYQEVFGFTTLGRNFNVGIQLNW